MWSVRNDTSLTPPQRAAAVPKVSADHPVGQWNSMDITVIGDRVTVMLNGKTVIDNAQAPGLPQTGPIGLQHHGGIDPKTGRHGPASSLVQFRNILVRPLTQKDRQQAAVPKTDADGFVTLFNGRDLTGWTAGPGRERTRMGRRTSSRERSRISPVSATSACKTTAGPSGTAISGSNALATNSRCWLCWSIVDG